MSEHLPTALMSIQELDEHGNPPTNSTPIVAQFNPASLQYTITNTAPSSGGNQRSREVEDSTGRLTFELVFDTTHDGSDVRRTTQRIAQLMRPAPARHRKTPTARLGWGEFRFEGALEQYQETLDFFSAEGIPLRATLSLVFTTVSVENHAPPIVFEFAGEGALAASATPAPFHADEEDTVEVPARNGSASDVATQLGDAGGARALAAANGLESLRTPLGAYGTLSVSPGVTLSPPIAFTTAGAGQTGFGVGAGAGFGVGVELGAGLGVGAGAGAGLGLGVSAGAQASLGTSTSPSLEMNGGAGVGLVTGLLGGSNLGGSVSGLGCPVSVGGRGSAGVCATQGAFSGLRARTRAPRRQGFDLGAAVTAATSAELATDDPGGFEVGGRARAVGSASFHADVGQHAPLEASLRFEEE